MPALSCSGLSSTGNSVRSDRPHLHAGHGDWQQTPPVSIEPGGGGPHDPGMEARVAKLEAAVEHIQTDVREIKGILARLAPAVDRIDGFLQATLPRLATKDEIGTEIVTLRSEIG